MPSLLPSSSPAPAHGHPQRLPAPAAAAAAGAADPGPRAAAALPPEWRPAGLEQLVSQAAGLSTPWPAGSKWPGCARHCNGMSIPCQLASGKQPHAHQPVHTLPQPGAAEAPIKQPRRTPASPLGRSCRRQRGRPPGPQQAPAARQRQGAGLPGTTCRGGTVRCAAVHGTARCGCPPRSAAGLGA